MPAGNMLELALALHDKLEAELPAIVTEVNATKQPGIPIVMPAGANTVILGIRTEMLDRELVELPAISCGVYVREVFEDGEQEFTEVLMPYTIDVYLGDTSSDDLYIKAHKWGVVLDLFVERFCSNLVKGYTTDSAPDMDISYVLELRDGTFRQLVSVTGIVTGIE